MSAYPSIAILAVYFGTLPRYFPAWLKSCSYNSEFRWFLFTDADLSAYDVPENVTSRSLTLQQFREKMAQELGFELHFQTPYKVCDFRPLFWVLLQEESDRYDFWGHCDMDMLFGDLQAFIEPSWFVNYDKIFSLGHLTLYRNNCTTNRMYRRMHPTLEWREILSDTAHRGFDEHIGINLIWKLHHGQFYENEGLVADIDPHLAAFKLVPPGNNYRSQVFCFERGKVFRGYYHGNRWCTQEFMYIHFQKRAFDVPDLPPGVDSFYITPRGFLARRDAVPSIGMVQSLNPVRHFESIAEIKYKCRQRVRRFVRNYFKPRWSQICE
jgi:hypothetical protein